MGLKSGEYGGKYSSLAPAAAMAWRTPATLCVDKLSMITKSSGCNTGTSPCLTQAKNNSPSMAPSNIHGAKPLKSHGRNQRAGLIMSLRNRGDEPFADRGSRPNGSFGAGPAFIHKHQPRGGYSRQLLRPVRPLFGHVGPLLLGGVQRFFYSSSPAASTTNPRSKFRRDGQPGAQLRQRGVGLSASSCCRPV